MAPVQPSHNLHNSTNQGGAIQPPSGSTRVDGKAVEWRVLRLRDWLKSDGSGDEPGACHRDVAWLTALGRNVHCVIEASSNDGRSAFPVQSGTSRAVPFHQILRLERFGESIPVAHALAIVDGLAAVSRRFDVLRAEVAVCTADETHRERIVARCRDLGFEPHRARHYTHTVMIDLNRSPSEILQSCHYSARRHIGKTNRRPDVEVRPVTDERHAEALSLLYRESFERSGGRSVSLPWERLIASARARPEMVRIAALVPVGAGTDSPLSFALAVRQRNWVEYFAAGATRRTGFSGPLGYGPAWDLICWAQGIGAEIFDFGGIDVEALDDNSHPLQGISRFKWHFGGTVGRVGQELRFEPHRARAWFATLLSRAGKRPS